MVLCIQSFLELFCLFVLFFGHNNTSPKSDKPLLGYISDPSFQKSEMWLSDVSVDGQGWGGELGGWLDAPSSSLRERGWISQTFETPWPPVTMWSDSNLFVAFIWNRMRSLRVTLFLLPIQCCQSQQRFYSYSHITGSRAQSKGLWARQGVTQQRRNWDVRLVLIFLVVQTQRMSSLWRNVLNTFLNLFKEQKNYQAS